MKKRVCFVNTVSSWGGGENWQIETMLALKEEVDLISICNKSGELRKRCQGFAKIHAFKTGSLSVLNPFKIYEAYRLLKKIAPDSILFNASSDFKLFALVAAWLGVKKILYRRDNGKPLSPHLLNKYLLQECVTDFLPCSGFIKDSALKRNEGLIAQEQISVIYNSINLEKWDREEALELIEKKDNTFYFGCIGRFSEEKGQLFLPEIAKKMKEEGLKFKILLAGKGSLEKELRDKIEALEVQEYFVFLGFVRHSKDFMNEVDCLLLPSLWEGLPTVAIEAMALEKPVIAFNVAGNPEIVKENITGKLIPAYDTQLFANAMVELMQNKDNCSYLGRNGRELVEKDFAQDKTLTKLKSFL